MDRATNGAGTVDQDEVARFSRLAGQWWDPRGPMAALHKFNPVRLAYIRDRAAEHFGRDPKRLDSLAGLRILDIGCGGGILSRAAGAARRRRWSAPIRRQRTSRWRRRHAAQSGLAVDYRDTTAETLAEAGETFDVVLAMEVVEHVTDVGLFVERAPRW